MPAFEFPPFKKKKDEKPNKIQDWMDGLKREMPEGFGPASVNPADSAHADIDTGPGETSPTPDTRAEWQERLRSTVTSASAHDPLELTPDQILPQEEQATAESTSQQDLTAYDRREARAQHFAEKYNITEVRGLMLEAEEDYKIAIRELKSRGIRSAWKKIPEQTHKTYLDACYNWRDAIEYAVRNEPKQEKQRATIITFRDTVMRAEEARVQATQEASSERSKQTFNKAFAWGTKGLQTAVAGYMGATDWVGEKSAKTHTWLREKAGKEGATEKQLIERYTRATRIVSSAALGTVLFGGVGTAGLALSGLWRATRGTLGIAIGSMTGKGLGSLYRKKIGESDISALKESKRNQFEYNNLENDRKNLRKGTISVVEKRTRTAQMVGAFLGGAYTSILSAEALHLFGSASVEQASDTLQDKPAQPDAPGPVVADGKPAIASETSTPSPQPTATPSASELATSKITSADQSYSPISLEVQKGEGADRLLADLQEKLHNLPKGVKMPAHLESIQKILNDNPHHLAQQLRLSHESGGIMLQPGDTLDINDKGQLVFHEAIHGNKPTVIIDEKGAINEKWLDRFKGNHQQALQEHHPKHDSHIKHSEPKHQGIRTSAKFDAKADHDAVARANLDELAREKAGVFGSTSAIAEAVEPNTPASPEPIAGIQSPEDFLKNTPDGAPASPPVAPGGTQPQAQAIFSGIVPDGVTQSGIRPSFDSSGILSPEEAIRQLETNHFGVRIDPDVPSAYTVTTPTGSYVAVYGGGGPLPKLAAEQYALSHPGVSVRFQAWEVSALGERTAYVQEIKANQSGALEIIKPTLEAPVPPPDIESFSSKQEFMYKPH